ncbi:MAG TPA: hypothetical protein VN493_04915 [Thermoanaerobaculia bacterium]|nr:hypothetical protein [Thermoanaerobaculia bacterium]
MGRQDFVEQQGHLVTEMASLAGHQLIAGPGNGSAEEHGQKDKAGPPPREPGLEGSHDAIN